MKFQSSSKCDYCHFGFTALPGFRFATKTLNKTINTVEEFFVGSNVLHQNVHWFDTFLYNLL